MDCSLPYKIGSDITIEEYNKFLERQESSAYKYQRKDNGDVFIIDGHGFVAKKRWQKSSWAISSIYDGSIVATGSSRVPWGMKQVCNLYLIVK